MTTESIASGTYADLTHAAEAAEVAGTAGDFLDELAELRRAATALDVATRTAIVTARANGASWADVGYALGITKQAAWERYGQRTA